jgi:hypothetical protein
VCCVFLTAGFRTSNVHNLANGRLKHQEQHQAPLSAFGKALFTVLTTARCFRNVGSVPFLLFVGYWPSFRKLWEPGCAKGTSAAAQVPEAEHERCMRKEFGDRRLSGHVYNYLSA